MLPHLMAIARAHEAALDMDIDLSDHPVLLPAEVDARARVRVRVWDPLFDTFLKRNWAQGASNIHRRKHSDDCGAAVGKHALVVFT